MALENVPCLSCKKRRIKCDSARPGCRRCHRDNLECPGYTKKTKWNHYDPQTAHKPKRISKTSDLSSNPSSDHSTNDESWRDMTLFAFSESPEDRENRLLLDATEYYNLYMLPETIPAHLPFRRGDLQATYWSAAPPIIRNLMILFVKSNQSKRAATGDQPSSEVCLYRGSSLNSLRDGLSEAANDPYGIVLAGVLVLMGIDMLDPATGQWNWAYHFRAARNIINLRGGFAKCFFGLPHSQGLLTRYMILDIFSSSTCSVSELEYSSIQAQSKYGPIILLREKSMLEKGEVCPQPLLQAIIDTNILRWRFQARKVPTLELDHVRQYEELMANIDRFDTSSWSARVMGHGLTQPLRADRTPDPAVSAAWNALACCYKQAAFLYCICSIRAPTEDDERSPVIHIQKSLSEQLHILFSMATSDPDGPVETQLWRFCLWPTTISMYVSICWCCCGFVEMTRELEELHSRSMALGNSQLMRCWEFMSDVAKRRCEMMDTGNAPWKWSDGFEARRAFLAC